MNQTPKGQPQLHSKRDTGLDILRVVTAFAVVFFHAASQYFAQSFPSAEWEARNVFMSMSHWVVPVFVMISGALFLNPLKQVTLRRLYTKNLLHIVVAYAVWSIVYGLYDLWLNGHAFGVGWLTAAVLTGPMHLWFLKMLAGIYIAIPVFRAVARDVRLERYFLILALATCTVLPMCIDATSHLHPTLGHLLGAFVDSLGLHTAAGFAGYFVLGHYLHNHRPGTGTRHLLLVMALVATAAMMALTHRSAHLSGKASEYYYNVFNILTLLQVVTVFAWGTKPRRLSPRMQRVVSHAAGVSFGIYLIHVLVIYVARYQLGIDRPTFTPWLFIPLHAVGVFGVAYALSSLLRLLPKSDRFLL